MEVYVMLQQFQLRNLKMPFYNIFGFWDWTNFEGIHNARLHGNKCYSLITDYVQKKNFSLFKITYNT